MLEDLERLWSNGQLAVLKKAPTASAELGVGLLEATEVVEPNPIRPNERPPPYTRPGNRADCQTGFRYVC